MKEQCLDGDAKVIKTLNHKPYIPHIIKYMGSKRDAVLKMLLPVFYILYWQMNIYLECMKRLNLR